MTLPPVTRLRRPASVAFLALVIALVPFVPVTANRLPGSRGVAPIVRILTPHDGVELNAGTLRVRAVVAAVRSTPSKQFSFDGATFTGRNAGEVSSVAIVVDGIAVETLDTSQSGPQVVASFELDTTLLSAGTHVLAVTAVGRRALETTEHVTFTLDPALPVAETNRIEEAATPEPFQGLVVHEQPWHDRSEAFVERSEDDDPIRFSTARFALNGRFTLSALSDGLDLTKDRVVVALGSETVVFDPADLACRGRVCRARGRGFVDVLKLERGRDGRWQFHLRGTRGSGSGMLFVRVGNDWGGFDLATGARIARLPEALDADHRVTGTVGDEGGTVQLLDAAGVLIRLDVPEGALTRETLITMTPLTTSPLAGAPQALHPGVKLEPEGLRFRQPATLTFDFSATQLDVTAEHSTFLLTSPMTTLPLSSVADPVAKTLTATLHHFSTPQPGPANPAFIDLKAWADPLLASTGNITLAEVELLVALSVQQQRLNCTGECIDLAEVARWLSRSIAALVSAQCSLDVGYPTDRTLERYLQLDALGQQLGADTTSIRPCLEGILRELIVRAGPFAVADPSSANLSRLVSLAARAQVLGFDSLQTQALRLISGAIRGRAQRVLAEVAAARGTQSEAEVTSRARTDLGLLLIYVQGPGAVVLLVDPELEAYLQAAIASLTDPQVQAFVLGERSFVQSGCSMRLGEEEECPAAERPLSVELPSNQELPVTLSTSAFTMKMEQTGPAVFTVDATVLAPRGDLGFVLIGFRLPRPGDLEVELNEAWQTSPAGQSCWIVTPVSPSNFPGGWDAIIAVEANSENIYNCPQGIDRVNRPFPYRNLAGNGRVATIRFVPQ